jgi:hypothetical protein
LVPSQLARPWRSLHSTPGGQSGGRSDITLQAKGAGTSFALLHPIENDPPKIGPMKAPALPLVHEQFVQRILDTKFPSRTMISINFTGHLAVAVHSIGCSPSGGGCRRARSVLRLAGAGGRRLA